jgi:3-deoxy-D-manno-octulosonic-acid transferase
LGEFEQAKPIIEKIRKAMAVNVIVTFFSPSGYENSKRYPDADIVSYLPFDSNSSAKRFYEIVQPTLGVFMRYDIWPNFVHYACKNKVPLFLVDATLRANSTRKSWWLRAFHRNLFAAFTGILTVSEQDLSSFEFFRLNIPHLAKVGDTRFDRVNEKSIEAKNRNLLRPEIVRNKKVFVAGSTWDEDEEILFPVLKKLLKFDNSVLAIIVPHEPTVTHIEKIEQDFAPELPTIRFSYLNEYNNQRIIIVDSIGILLSLYYYAAVAFVGGSFKSSIHNVLEAAVYNIPVIYGPKIQSSIEAKELARIGGGIILNGRDDAYRTLRGLMNDNTRRESMGKISKNYIVSNIGAADKIVHYLLPYLTKNNAVKPHV